MPQTFQVLRCYKCVVFQVHQTKKANKFQCKMCGEKQSIKRHYGLGTAQECRFHVQKLNGIRGEIDEINTSMNSESDDNDEDCEVKLEQATPFRNPNSASVAQSKWSDFVEEEDKGPNVETDDTMFLEDTEVVLELPQKRRKVFGNTKSRKVLKAVESNQHLELNDSDDFIPTKLNTISSPKSSIAKIENTQLEIEKVIQPKEQKPMPVNESSNKKSKWAQYAADAEDANEDSNIEPLTQNKGIELFSQYEDSDLDNILDL